MMRQMRENTKWIMLITALAFVGLMIFEWGMDLSGRSSTDVAGGEIGSVDGDPITADEYNIAYRNLYQQQQAQLGGQTITPAMNRQIEDAAWEQLVANKLLERELRRRGVRVTDAEVLDAARYAPPPEFMENPAFQTNGQFDLARYQQYIATNLDDATLAQLESYYREVIPRSKLYFQTTAGVTVSDDQLWRMWRDANERVQVRYLAWDPAALVPAEQVQVSDAAVRSYYDRNKADFVRPARANVRYLVIEAAPSAADSAAALQQVRQLRERIAGGETFAAVARELSVDTTTPDQRLNLTVTRGMQQFPPALEQAAFNTPVGQLSQPVLTQFGYHLVRPTSIEGENASVEQLLVPIEPSTEREDELFERVDSLEVLAERYNLQQVGQQLGIPVQTADLTPPLTFLPGVGTADDGVLWAMREAERGDVSEVFETGDVYYIMELLSRTEEGTLSVQEATPTIRAILVQQQQVEKARQQLQPAVAAARSGQPLQQVAASSGAQVQEAGPFSREEAVPGLGRFNAAIGTAFGLRQGQVSELVEAEGRLFLIELVRRETPDRTAWQAQLPQLRGRVIQSLADQRWQQYLEGLRKNAKVVDRRAEQSRAAQAAQARM